MGGTEARLRAETHKETSTEQRERPDGDTNLLETPLGAGMNTSSRKGRTSDETRVAGS